MKKIQSQTLVAAITKVREDAARQIKRLQALDANFAIADAIVSVLPEEMKARISTYISWSNKVEIEIDVVSFKDTLPALEAMMEFGIGFSESRDDPDWNQRSYSGEGVTVTAHLIGAGSEGCKRVIKTWRVPDPVPVYEFVCEDEVVGPAEAVAA